MSLAGVLGALWGLWERAADAVESTLGRTGLYEDPVLRARDELLRQQLEEQDADDSDADYGTEVRLGAPRASAKEGKKRSARQQKPSSLLLTALHAAAP